MFFAISNKSRSNESIIFQNAKNKIDHNEQLSQHSPKQNLKQDLQFNTTRSANEHNKQQESENTKISRVNLITTPMPVNKALQAIINNIDQARNEQIASANNDSALIAAQNKGWFKRKKLADFYPLSQEDADLLQIKSNREFNLDFINKLLLKLAGEYSNHHFGHKKVLLNYMAKALACELRETTKANNANFQFKSADLNKTKEQYLDNIERSTDTSKQSQLKRKIVGIFDPDTAYELLSSCCFIGVIGNNYQIKLLKTRLLSEHSKDKILQQVQMIYGNHIKQLQIIPFTELEANQHNSEDEKQDYLLQLGKQLNPESIWYKARKFLIERYDKYIDFSILSKLMVVDEDMINKKVTLKSISAFNDYYVRNRYMQDLEEAFAYQNFTFELIKF